MKQININNILKKANKTLEITTEYGSGYMAS